MTLRRAAGQARATATTPNVVSDMLEQLLSQGWVRKNLAGGERLWGEGDPADTMAWVVRGALEVRVAGRSVARVEGGELLGEVTVFREGSRRTGQVQALEPTELLVLDRGTLLRLRGDAPATYAWVLGRAITSLADRVDRLWAHVAQLDPGDAEPVPPDLDALFETSPDLRHVTPVPARDLGAGDSSPEGIARGEVLLAALTERLAQANERLARASGPRGTLDLAEVMDRIEASFRAASPATAGSPA